MVFGKFLKKELKNKKVKKEHNNKKEKKYKKPKFISNIKLTKREKILIYILGGLGIIVVGWIGVILPSMSDLTLAKGNYEQLKTDQDTVEKQLLAMTGLEDKIEGEKIKLARNKIFFYNNLTDSDIDIYLQNTVEDCSLKYIQFSVENPVYSPLAEYKKPAIGLDASLEKEKNDQEVTMSDALGDESEKKENTNVLPLYTATILVEGKMENIIKFIDKINTLDKSSYVGDFTIAYSENASELKEKYSTSVYPKQMIRGTVSENQTQNSKIETQINANSNIKTSSSEVENKKADSYSKINYFLKTKEYKRVASKNELPDISVSSGMGRNDLNTGGDIQQNENTENVVLENVGKDALEQLGLGSLIEDSTSNTSTSNTSTSNASTSNTSTSNTSTSNNQSVVVKNNNGVYTVSLTIKYYYNNK